MDSSALAAPRLAQLMHPLKLRCPARMQVRPEDIYAALCRQTVDLVFTAHPTQVLGGR